MIYVKPHALSCTAGLCQTVSSRKPIARKLHLNMSHSADFWSSFLSLLSEKNAHLLKSRITDIISSVSLLRNLSRPRDTSRRRVTKAFSIPSIVSSVRMKLVPSRWHNTSSKLISRMHLRTRMHSYAAFGIRRTVAADAQDARSVPTIVTGRV